MPNVRHLSRYFAVALFAGAVVACDKIQSVARTRELTPHERYAESLRTAGLATSAMGREWLAAGDTVLASPHEVVLPFQESGYYDRGMARAVGWQFAVRDGQRVTVTLTADGQQAQIFADLFVVTTDSIKHFERIASSVTDTTQQSALRYDAKDSLTLVLRVQPELLRGGRFHVTIRSEPLLGFPVQGRGNAAVQSFWGVDRDGGARSHQGIDIFAPRGTPVLAATDGRIASIRPNPLGGNVVWQSDDHRSQNLYYAHLDRHNVVGGQYAKAGDTIGFVGNTGNARTTSPHLHFGIYRRGQGAIDPWPYVRRNSVTLATIRADTTKLGARVQVRGTGVSLRVAPVSTSATVLSLGRADTVTIVGASSNFFRIELRSGVAGYVAAGTEFNRM